MDTTIYNVIEEMGVIPVVTIQDIAHVIPITNALIQGEIPCIEITFRSDFAIEAIKKIRSTYSDILLGAGTVTTITQAQHAIDAGADFIASPGFFPPLIEYCIQHNIVIIPNTYAGAHIDKALEYKLPVVKFFPVQQLGGLHTIEALASVYPIKFFVTGGITKDNVVEYISSPHVIAVGGSLCTPKKVLQQAQFDKITTLSKEIIQQILDLSLMHIGINSQGKDNATNITQELTTLLGQTSREVPGVSYFVGTEYEIMYNGLGTHGHFALGTNSMAVAMRVLASRGYTFNKDFIRYDNNNRLYIAYFTGEIAGFAYHLLQK